MARSFADIAQELRDRAAISFTSTQSPLAQSWYEAVTVSSDCFGACPLTVESANRTGINITADTAGDQNGKYFDLEKDGVVFRIYLDVAPFGDVTPVAPPDFSVVGISQNATSAEIAQAIAESFRCFCDENNVLAGVKAYWKDTRLFVDDKNGVTIFSDAGTTTYTTESVAVTVCDANLPQGFRIGDAHECCEYLKLVDLWMTGGDDHHLNWVKVYQVDFEKLERDCDDFRLDDLMGNVVTTDFPYFDESRKITEEFEITNPNCYERKPQCTPHPCYPEALLISEKITKDGAKAYVTRVYHDVAELSDQAKFGFEVAYECQTTGSEYPIVTWTYDSLLTDFAPPQCGTAIPIGIGSDLDFSGMGLVLIEPPTFLSENPCYGRVTAKYGKLPGYQQVTERTDDELCETTTYTQRVSSATALPGIGDTFESATVISAEAMEEHCCVKTLRVTTATIPSPWKISERENRDFCKVETHQSVQLDSYALPAIGATFATKTVIAVDENVHLCDQLKRVSITVATLTDSDNTTTYVHPELCTVNRHEWIDAAGTALPTTTYSGEQVYKATSEKFQCDALSRYVVETVPVPTGVFKEIQIDDAVLGATETHHQFYDDDAPVLPEIGDTYDSEEVVGVSMAQAACKMKKVTIITSNIPADYDHFETVAYTFPPIYRYRVELPLTVKARVSYSFTTNPAIVTLLSPQSFISNLQAIDNSVDINGVSLRSQIAQPWRDLGNALHDQINLFNPGTSRAIPDLAVVVSASVPSATIYLGWISGGTEFVLSDSIEKWKGNIWVRKTARIVAH